MAYRLVTNLVTVWTLAYFSRGKFFSTAYLTYFLLPCDKIWQRPLEQLQEEDFRGKWLTQFYLVYRSCVPVLCCTGHGRSRKHADISPHTVFWPTTDTAATSRVCEWISFCGIRLPVESRVAGQRTWPIFHADTGATLVTRTVLTRIPVHMIVGHIVTVLIQRSGNIMAQCLDWLYGWLITNMNGGKQVAQIKMPFGLWVVLAVGHSQLNSLCTDIFARKRSTQITQWITQVAQKS